ncbi:MAG TPA: DUF4386 domain-containing protein, partial [Microlunatus sp.]
SCNKVSTLIPYGFALPHTASTSDQGGLKGRAVARCGGWRAGPRWRRRRGCRRVREGSPRPALRVASRRAGPPGPHARPSLIGGVALLLLAVLAGLANFGIVEVLVTPGDAARTAQDLIDSEALFRSGIAGLIVVVLLDIVVACSLLAVFESVNRSVAIMAAVFRIAYATVFLVAISQLVSVLELLGDADEALQAVGQFHTIWDASYALFGVHLALIGYLVYRSGFAPRLLGVLLVLAGLGYLVDEIGSVLVSGYALEISRFSFVGEAVLIFWLLIKGVRLHGSGTR